MQNSLICEVYKVFKRAISNRSVSKCHKMYFPFSFFLLLFVMKDREKMPYFLCHFGTDQSATYIYMYMDYANTSTMVDVART